MKGAGHPRRRTADNKNAKYEPVWITCDDIAAEGILVSSLYSHIAIAGGFREAASGTTVLPSNCDNPASQTHYCMVRSNAQRS
jgi:hypothetical protein